MAVNPYYTHSGVPTIGAPGTSATMRAEFDAVQTGFAKLPTLAGNGGKVVRVAGSNDSLVAVYNNWPIAGAFDATQVGSVYMMSADVTIPAATYAAGDILRLYNNTAGNLNVLAGGGLTLFQGGTAGVGNRVLAQRGFANVWFSSQSTAVIFGTGVS